MKRFAQAVLICALGPSLLGCEAGSKIDTLWKMSTITVTNPVDAANIYEAKGIYALSLEGGAAYRQYCWSKSYIKLMKDPVARHICANRRPVVRAMTDADTKAFFTITEAENFVRDNPTLSPAVVIKAALDAAKRYRAVVNAAAKK